MSYLFHQYYNNLSSYKYRETFVLINKMLPELYKYLFWQQRSIKRTLERHQYQRQHETSDFIGRLVKKVRMRSISAKFVKIHGRECGVTMISHLYNDFFINPKINRANKRDIFASVHSRSATPFHACAPSSLFSGHSLRSVIVFLKPGTRGHCNSPHRTYTQYNTH